MMTAKKQSISLTLVPVPPLSLRDIATSAAARALMQLSVLEAA